MSDNKKDNLDLLYLLNKLYFLAPYKKSLFISVMVGVFIGYFIHIFLPLKVNIEYTVKDLKNDTANQIFISTIQQASSKKIDNGKIKLIRDSNGKTIRFIVTGFGKNEDAAHKQALKISTSIFNKSANHILLRNINTINLEVEKAKLENDEAVFLLEIELRKLQSTLQTLELMKSKIPSDNTSHIDSVQLKQDYLWKRNISLNDFLLEQINTKLAATKINIVFQQQKIAQQNNIINSDPSKLKIFNLIKNNSQDIFTSREALESETLNLIDESLKLMDKSNNIYNQLFFLKTATLYNNYQLNSMENNGQILNSEKKYTMLLCVLTGIIFSSIFTVFAIVIRINYMRKKS